MRNEQAFIWQSLDVEDIISKVDLPFLEQIIELVCQNAIIANPISPTHLRAKADFAFARGLYNDAIVSYLGFIFAIERTFLTLPPDDNITKETYMAKFDLDPVYTKIVASLYFLRMPTLALVFGQFREDIAEHIKLVEVILQSTQQGMDAGPLYFPLIFDFELAEEMAVVYDKLDLTLHLNELLKCTFDRYVNRNNPDYMIAQEVERRKRRLLDILTSQFFELNL